MKRQRPSTQGALARAATSAEPAARAVGRVAQQHTHAGGMRRCEEWKINWAVKRNGDSKLKGKTQQRTRSAGSPVEIIMKNTAWGTPTYGAISDYFQSGLDLLHAQTTIHQTNILRASAAKKKVKHVEVPPMCHAYTNFSQLPTSEPPT